MIRWHVTKQARASLFVLLALDDAELVELRDQLAVIVGDEYVERYELRGERLTNAVHQLVDARALSRRDLHAG